MYKVLHNASNARSNTGLAMKIEHVLILHYVHCVRLHADNYLIIFELHCVCYVRCVRKDVNLALCMLIYVDLVA